MLNTEIYAAAKETVALAEQRFMSNSHEWQFDNAWQEMLNHATIKVCLLCVCVRKQQRKSLSFTRFFFFFFIILYSNNGSNYVDIDKFSNRRLWMLKNRKLIAMQTIN